MSMMSLNDDERREVFGEVLMDELRVIREYLSDIPIIKKDVRELKQITKEHTQILQRHDVLLRIHDRDIEQPKAKCA